MVLCTCCPSREDAGSLAYASVISSDDTPRLILRRSTFLSSSGLGSRLLSISGLSTRSLAWGVLRDVSGTPIGFAHLKSDSAGLLEGSLSQLLIPAAFRSALHVLNPCAESIDTIGVQACGGSDMEWTHPKLGVAKSGGAEAHLPTTTFRALCAAGLALLGRLLLALPVGFEACRAESRGVLVRVWTADRSNWRSLCVEICMGIRPQLQRMVK